MTLHTFTDGASDGRNPFGSLTLSGSTLYGITFGGGSGGLGTLFSMNTDGTGFGLLHSFIPDDSDGGYSYGSLTISDSKLYGMSVAGGSSNNGVLFSMNTDGTGFSLLHSFNNLSVSDGGSPHGSLKLSGSRLYGMTVGGGSSGDGAIFSMNTDGTGFGLLHSFTGGASDGKNPYGSLTLSGSTLYGMTSDGGNIGAGTIFSINTDGTGYGLLHIFTGGGASDGGYPYGSLTLFGSKLYGMSLGGGSRGSGAIFSMNTDGSGFSLLHSFSGGSRDGSSPYGSLTLSGSTLYGTTFSGGSSNAGTIFSIGTDGSGFDVLDSFGDAPDDGANPVGGDLTLFDDGAALYGMTTYGGTTGQGTVFSRSLVPEPGTFALLGLGTLLLSARRRNARAGRK